MSDELKACPWCHTSHVVIAWARPADDVQWRRVECPNCHANGPQRTREAEAIAAWSTRAPDTRDEEIAALVGALKRISGPTDDSTYQTLLALGIDPCVEARKALADYRKATQ